MPGSSCFATHVRSSVGHHLDMTTHAVDQHDTVHPDGRYHPAYGEKEILTQATVWMQDVMLGDVSRIYRGYSVAKEMQFLIVA